MPALAEAGRAGWEGVYEQAKRLKVRVLRDVMTRFAGAYASAFRGSGLEFAEVRHYEPGDDVRRMDWQVTARRLEPYVRRYAEERELRVLIAVDASGSMGSLSAGSARKETACKVVAALALSAAANGDRVGGLLFADRVVAVIPPRRGQRHALGVVRQAMSEQTAAATDLRPALSHIRNLRGHAVVFLVTDFLVEPAVTDPGVRKLLAACARKHDLRAVWLSAMDLTGCAGDATVELAEPESGRFVSLAMLGRGTNQLAAVTHAHGVRTSEALRSCRVPVAELKPRGDYLAGLAKLLAQRRRR